MRPYSHLSPSVVSHLSFRLPAVKTVYCMSEAELVDVALGVLIEVRSGVPVLMLRTTNFTGRS